jgi:hypothetical protein
MAPPSPSDTAHTPFWVCATVQIPVPSSIQAALADANVRKLIEIKMNAKIPGRLIMSTSSFAVHIRTAAI